MYLDVADLRDFYATPLGRLAGRYLTPVLAGLVRVDAGTKVLGFGFATPYLGIAQGAERVLAFMPAGQGVIDWPARDGSATALVEEDSLPLPDASIDLVVLVHGLEMSPRPEVLIAELRRVLCGGGRLLVVVPNRQGPWARSDYSPFGFGRPYSRGQLRHILVDAGFEAEAWTTALHMPPIARRPLIGAAGALDRIGRVVWPAFAGVIVASAVKRNVHGVPARARLRLAPSFQPAFRPTVGIAGRLPP
jgi:SAM-dependent methyltransferase